MYQKEDNIELKQNLSLIIAIILNASFIYSQLHEKNNSKIEYDFENYFSVYKLIIYLNYILCFINTFIVFFNKKKYQILYSKLDDLSIKKRINIGDINEYVPNWATTYWGIIYYPFYKYFHKKKQENYRINNNGKKSKHNKKSSSGTDNKYMYIKIWDPPFFSINLFCYYSPPQLLYISQARQNNWYKYAFLAFIISIMLHIIVNLCINLVGDKDLINKEVFKEYNEKFVYNKLCIPKFNKCVGTDPDLFYDDQEQPSFYQNVSFKRMNPYDNYEPNSYSHQRYNDSYYINNQRSFTDNYKNNSFIKNYQDYYYRDRDNSFSSNNRYNRNSFQYNPNESMNNSSFNRSYTRREQYSQMDYPNSHIVYDNKHSPIKSKKKISKYNSYINNLSFEINDTSNIPKISDVDENGEFVVTTNNTNPIDSDENGYFKSNLRNDYRKELLSEKMNSFNKSASLNKPPSFSKTPSFNKNSSFNKSTSLSKTPTFNRTASINKSPSKTSSIYSTSNTTLVNNNHSDKRNLSFSDRSKFVIIDKKEEENPQNKNYEHEKKRPISHNDTFNNNMKKFQFIDKKDIKKTNSEISNIEIKSTKEKDNKDDDYVCLLDSLE